MARHDQGLLLRFRRNLGLRKTAYDWDLPLAAVRRVDSRTDSRRVAAPAQRPGPREDPTASQRRHLSLCQSMARHDQGLLLRFRRNLGLRKTAYDWDLPLAAVRRDDSRTDSRRVAAPAQRLSVR